jgi:hypothetical protein
VWDDQPSDPTKYIGYEVWNRGVAVDPSRAVIPPGETADVTFLHGVFQCNLTTPIPPVTYKGARVVPLSDFYSQRLGEADLAALGPADRALLDASSYWAYGREFRPGDYLVQISLHIITREIDAWTFQSVWWHDKADAGPYAADRPNIPPAKAPGPWRHYLMVSEYGIPDASRPENLPVAYNPYIELAAAHPVATNCRNCHVRAAWPRHGAGTPSASYQAAGGPGALVDLKPDDPILDGLTRTDFQWAVSDRAIPVPASGSPTPCTTK